MSEIPFLLTVPGRKLRRHLSHRCGLAKITGGSNQLTTGINWSNFAHAVGVIVNKVRRQTTYSAELNQLIGEAAIKAGAKLSTAAALAGGILATIKKLGTSAVEGFINAAKKDDSALIPYLPQNVLDKDFTFAPQHPSPPDFPNYPPDIIFREDDFRFLRRPSPPALPPPPPPPPGLPPPPSGGPGDGEEGEDLDVTLSPDRTGIPWLSIGRTALFHLVTRLPADLWRVYNASPDERRPLARRILREILVEVPSLSISGIIASQISDMLIIPAVTALLGSGGWALLIAPATYWLLKGIIFKLLNKLIHVSKTGDFEGWGITLLKKFGEFASRLRKYLRKQGDPSLTALVPTAAAFKRDREEDAAADAAAILQDELETEEPVRGIRTVDAPSDLPLIVTPETRTAERVELVTPFNEHRLSRIEQLRLRSQMAEEHNDAEPITHPGVQRILEDPRLRKRVAQLLAQKRKRNS